MQPVERSSFSPAPTWSSGAFPPTSVTPFSTIRPVAFSATCQKRDAGRRLHSRGDEAEPKQRLQIRHGTGPAPAAHDEQPGVAAGVRDRRPVHTG